MASPHRSSVNRKQEATEDHKVTQFGPRNGEGRHHADRPRTALITGGAGFIGSNLAERLLADPTIRVRIFDNLSRPGVERNLAWLRKRQGGRRLHFIKGDVRDFKALQYVVADVTEIYHFAAQVAVTTSVTNPAEDFGINAQGTFNVLEAARQSGGRPFFLYTSTNKVYGSLKRLNVEVQGSQYRVCEPTFRGVNEHEPLDFHSPYGCSKGAADQYVRDYARIYEIPSVVFRMSCIAGPRQFGNEDQGWVAHFLYSALEHRPVVVYGNGYQVRDVLHVYDLVDAMVAARNNIERTHGQVYNLGGGMERSISVIQLLRAIQRRTRMPIQIKYSDVRPGDQPIYITDTSKLEQHTGWKPRRSLAETLDVISEFWTHSCGRIPASEPSAIEHRADAVRGVA